MKVPNLSSIVAILDVGRGRVGLSRIVEKGYRVPVTIQGYIDSPWGSDDGRSIDFNVDVTSVETGEPVLRKEASE